MNVTFYLPFYKYSDTAFDMADNALEGVDYANKLREEYEKTKHGVDAYMHGDVNSYRGTNGQTYVFGQKNTSNDDYKYINYSSCDGKLLNINGELENVDDLISHFSKQEMFISKFILDMNDCQEEFESEIYLWIKEHNNIQKYASKGEDWVLMNEPKRNVRVIFNNKANENVYAEFVNCKIIENIRVGEMTILVEKIKLIDKFV